MKMADLFRNILLNKLVDLLKKSNLPFQTNIVNSFPIKIPQDRLPIIFVSAPMDHAIAKSIGPPNYRRTCLLALQCFVNYADIEKGKGDLNSLCYAVEQAIQCDYDFNGSIEGIAAFKFNMIYHSETGIQIAEARYEIECQYSENFYRDGPPLKQINGSIP